MVARCEFITYSFKNNGHAILNAVPLKLYPQSNHFLLPPLFP